ALDKRTSIGMVGGLDKYIKYQSGQALEEGAKHGGGISDGLGIGVGVALGKRVGDSMTPEQPAPQNTQQPPQIPKAGRYYIAVDGNSEGPFTLDELKSKAQSGLVKADTLVWQPGMDNWQTVSEFDELKSLLNTMTPPPIPPAK
ncbi:MAG: GYF domain-containing protein, partial [Methylococcales bacterium]